MMRLAALGTFLLAACACGAADDADLLKAIAAVSKNGPASPAARSAWDQLVAQGPASLPQLLQAMDTPDTVVANWLRTAFDRIVDAEMKAGGKRIDADVLLAFVQDAKRQGRARRLALDVVDQLRPGTNGKLMTGWLNDPEFRYEAVEALTKQADSLSKDGSKDKALTEYRKAFTACREVPQAQELARRLKDLSSPVSIAEHFGFLTDWHVIGPFDAKGMKGFKTVYPPEEKIDLAAEYTGKDGKLKWKRYRVTETLSGLPARAVLANLVEPLGQADDAVAYAYTAFTMPAAQDVEFRGSADDNFTVWVNGQRVFGFEEYRNGVRLDRHRFPVKLRLGVNTVLVKICQAPVDPTNPEPNWEFMLRVVDADGKGLPIRSVFEK